MDYEQYIIDVNIVIDELRNNLLSPLNEIVRLKRELNEMKEITDKQSKYIELLERELRTSNKKEIRVKQ